MLVAVFELVLVFGEAGAEFGEALVEAVEFGGGVLVGFLVDARGEGAPAFFEGSDTALHVGDALFGVEVAMAGEVLSEVVGIGPFFVTRHYLNI